MELARGFLKSIFEREGEAALALPKGSPGRAGTGRRAARGAETAGVDARRGDAARQGCQRLWFRDNRGCQSGRRRCERGRRDRPERARYWRRRYYRPYWRRRYYVRRRYYRPYLRRRYWRRRYWRRRYGIKVAALISLSTPFALRSSGNRRRIAMSLTRQQIGPALSPHRRRGRALRDDQRREAHPDHRRGDFRRRHRQARHRRALEPPDGRDPSRARRKSRDLLPRPGHLSRSSISPSAASSASCTSIPPRRTRKASPR